MHTARPSLDPVGSGDGGPIGESWREPTYRVDLRTGPPDVFRDLTATDWSELSWERLGRPYRVERISRRRRLWEEERGETMPVPVQWENFNRNFHELFVSTGEDRRSARRRFLRRLARLDLPGARQTGAELGRLALWNWVHRIEDAVWDPRGKRALFEGLDLERPRILFLGAADGYEAMQLSALYPGGEAVLVDYDAFCERERFGNFPSGYPFLGRDPATGGPRVYRRDDFRIDFVVEDIRDLDFGAEFDIVLSVGLLEHFPDDLKAGVLEIHRRHLRPGGFVILTTPRRQLRSRFFYVAMAELMNFGYRELMDPLQLGLYAWEAGFDVVRCGLIKAHNGVVLRRR